MESHAANAACMINVTLHAAVCSCTDLCVMCIWSRRLGTSAVLAGDEMNHACLETDNNYVFIV